MSIRKTIKTLITIILALSFLPGKMDISKKVNAALPQAIFNYPSDVLEFTSGDFTPGDTIALDASEIEWTKIIDHPGYDSQAYTTGTSKAYNGEATENHVVFDGNNIRFLGYDKPAYMDMVFNDVSSVFPNGFGSISFSLKPIIMNFHTFSEAGILFNGSFTGDKYTGYALVLKCGNLAGMLENAPSATNTAILSLLYINNETMNGDLYSPGTIATTRTLIGTFKTDIQNLTTPTFNVAIDRDTNTGAFIVSLDGSVVSVINNPVSDGVGFGFYTAYYAHDCYILSVIEFSDLILHATPNLDPVETSAKVRFVDYYSGLDIEDEQVINGYVADKYWIEVPEIAGYKFVKADRRALNSIIYRTDSANNETILYYSAFLDIEKSAIYDGHEDVGDADSPVLVEVGENIEYNVNLTNPGGTIDFSGDSGISVDKLWVSFEHAIAKTPNGEFYVWGWNTSSQLGIGSFYGPTFGLPEPTYNPYLTADDIEYRGEPETEVVDIWCGHSHNIAKTSDGKFYVWGLNTSGQLGLGNTSPVAVPTYNPYLSGADIVDIWIYGWFNIAKTSDGSYYVWGNNTNSQLGLGPGKGSIIDIPTLNPYLTAGSSEYVGASGTSITDIYLGFYSGIAKASDGSCFVWGLNNQGQLGLGHNTSPIEAPEPNPYLTSLSISDIWAGHSNYIAKTSDGNFYVWGSNSSGSLGMGPSYIYISSLSTPTPNPYLTNGDSLYINSSGADIVDIWMGIVHTIVKTSDGEFYVCGNNYYGELGIGPSYSSVYNQHELFYNSNLTSVIDIWTYGQFNIAKTSDGDYYVWGDNSYGQLGLGVTGAVQRAPIKSPYLTTSRYFTITDILPEGLSVVMAGTEPGYSISGVDDDLGDFKISVSKVGSQDKLDIEFNRYPSGNTTISFRALVEQVGYFENVAELYDVVKDMEIESNPTYHATGNKVTEKYQDYSAPNDTLKDDTYRTFGTWRPNRNYSPYPSVMSNIIDGSGNTWRYYAYKLDNGPIIVGMPPNGADVNEEFGIADYYWCWRNLSADHEITLYFIKDVVITVNYHESKTTTELKLPTKITVPGNIPYYMLESYMNSFSDGADYWNYANEYKINNSGLQLGKPDTPVFSVADMIDGDCEITLYFSKSPMLTIQFREFKSNSTDRINGQLLYDDKGNNKETFFLDDTLFDILSDSTIVNAIEKGTESIIKKQYKIYKGWSVDGGLTVNGPEVPLPQFDDDQGNQEVILYFSTEYVVTEKYLTAAGDVLMPDDISVYSDDDVFEGNPPAFINKDGKKWNYIGYIIDGSDEDVPTAGIPKVENINSDFIVIYIYELSDEIPDSFVVINRWYGLGDPVTQLIANETVTYIGSGPHLYTDDIRSFVGYVYEGWILDGEDFLSLRSGNPSESIELSSLDNMHTITYVYRKVENSIVEHVIRERYLTKSGEVLIPDDTSVYQENETFTGNPPAFINKDGKKWNYIGYVIDGSYEDVPTAGTPIVDNIQDSFTVIYIYELSNDDPDDSFIVTNRWYALGSPSTQIIANETVLYSGIGPHLYTDQIRSFTGYVYEGWVLDGEDFLSLRSGNPSDSTELSALNEMHTITYVYSKTETPNEPKTADIMILLPLSVMLLTMLSISYIVSINKKRLIK